MLIRVKNWKLASLALVFFCLFISLGCWQLSRAEQKKILLATFQKRTQQTPLTAKMLAEKEDLRFYPVQLKGKFDNTRVLFLDNKILHGKVGYEIYTPFKAENMPSTLLIDRGFVPIIDRKTSPNIEKIEGNVTIFGILNRPPSYISFGEMLESKAVSFPLRIQYVNLEKLASLLSKNLFPYVVMLKKDQSAYQIDTQIVTMPPEKHLGYAVQWFALALTLLILFVALNRRSSN